VIATWISMRSIMCVPFSKVQQGYPMGKFWDAGDLHRLAYLPS
jgi:hypothetical protein